MGESFSDLAFRFSDAQAKFEDALMHAGLTFERIGWDWYDNSLEIYDVPPEERLSEAAQKVIFDAGFSIAFVNHTDKWETHYTWRGDFKGRPGWRVRYGHKMTPTQEGIEVESAPPSWPKEWFKSGYAKIVGLLRTAPQGEGT